MANWWPTWKGEQIRLVLDHQQDLPLQPDACQSSFKRSDFLHNADRQRLQDLRGLLGLRHLQADLIYSSQRDLDVVPTGVSKGTAARFLARRWRVPPSQVIVSGDSGNDLSIFVQGFRGVVVGNAQKELSCLTGPTVFHSCSPFADGVVERVEYWRRSSEDLAATDFISSILT